MLDLMALPQRYRKAIGDEKIAEIVGETPERVGIWIMTRKFPMEAMSKLLAYDPFPIHEIRPLYETPAPGTRLAILLPTNRPICPATMDTIIPMFNVHEMQFHRESFNSLYHVRNMAAAWYLKSGCEWSWWSDDDLIHPCNDAPLFKRLLNEHTAIPVQYSDAFAGANSILQLRSRGKKLIGACYFGRKQGVPGQFSGADSARLRADLRHGPRNLVLPVDWVGFGSTLVHRSVFEDIIKTQGEKIRVKNEFIRSKLGYEYSFFWPIDQDFGDDVSFCARAREAGHQPWVDLSLMPAHVGQRAFTFADQRAG